MGNITVIKKKTIPDNLFVVIISPFTNHFTAGVIIEFQAEITVYCDTCTITRIIQNNPVVILRFAILTPERLSR